MLPYTIVTPARNEEDNLPRLIQSIRSQTHLPVSWVVVNDGSTDATPALLKEAAKELSFLEILTLPPQQKAHYDRGFKYSFVVKQGFDHVLESPERCRDIKLLGIVDADMFFRPDYFEELTNRFASEPKLGVASGIIYSKHGNHFIKEKDRPEQPRGSGRLIRMDCLEECGGYHVYKSMDSILNIKARKRGWLTRSFSEMKMYQSRVTFSRRSYWHGFAHQGRVSYYFGTPPFMALLKAGRYILLRPHHVFLPYLYGYFKDYFAKRPMIPDPEIVNFYRNEHLRIGFHRFVERRSGARRLKKERGRHPGKPPNPGVQAQQEAEALYQDNSQDSQEKSC